MRNEAGQALPMAMVLLIVGGLVIVPLLNFITGNMKASQVMEDKVYDFYAADAGAEDGLWKVRYDYLPDWLIRRRPIPTSPILTQCMTTITPAI